MMKSFMTYLLESDKKDKFQPIDETEAIHLNIDDNCLNQARIAAYNIGQTLPDDKNPEKEVPVNPKKFPTKAIDIIIPVDELQVELYFDPESKSWDSDVVYRNQHVKLSPDQFEGFFMSQFYSKLLNKLQNTWPLTDTFYGELYDGLCQKQMKIGPTDPLNEALPDKKMANKDVTGDGKRDFTASGRKIIHFTDMNVSNKGAMFFCWPDLKKLDSWSTWKDWRKIRPLCRMRFMYNGIPYGLTISIMKDEHDVKYRGFRGYSLDPTLPPVQWLTSEENEDIIKLSIVNRFIKHCIEKLEKYGNMSVEEILKIVDEPERLCKEEVEATQTHIRKSLLVIKARQIDTFKW